MKLKSRVWSAALALGLIGSQLDAQVIAVSGSTSGCFYTTVVCTPTATATDFFLTFTQGTFSGFTDASGFFALNSASNNFGSFFLGDNTANYAGQKFLLQVAFTAPNVLGPGAIFTASVIGDVVANVSGGADILFDNAPQPVQFNGPTESGTLTVNVYDVFLNRTQTSEIDGFIHTSIAPEPGTTALVATGLMGLIPMARIKRRKKDVA